MEHIQFRLVLTCCYYNKKSTHKNYIFLFLFISNRPKFVLADKQSLFTDRRDAGYNKQLLSLDPDFTQTR